MRLEKLETLLFRYGQLTLADAPLFAALLSVPSVGRYPPLDMTPQRQKDLTIDALIRQALARTPEKPALALFEDVHWIDPTTLELLDRTVAAIKASRMLDSDHFQAGILRPVAGPIPRNHVATGEAEQR